MGKRISISADRLVEIPANVEIPNSFGKRLSMFRVKIRLIDEDAEIYLWSCCYRTVKFVRVFLWRNLETFRILYFLSWYEYGKHLCVGIIGFINALL